MVDETSADSLVTETTPIIPDGATVIHPGAAIDPAAVLDPGKVKPAPVKKAKRRRAPKAKRERAIAAASASAGVKSEASSAAAIAAEEHKRALRDEGQAAYDAAEAHEVDGFTDLPADAALMLRLSNGEAFVEGTISVDPKEIVPAAIGHTYTKDIDIGPNCAPVQVTEAWLVSLAGEAVRCAVGPLSAGDGHHARIPAGHLKF